MVERWILKSGSLMRYSEPFFPTTVVRYLTFHGSVRQEATGNQQDWGVFTNSPSASNRPYQAKPRRLKQVHSGGKWPADRGESGPYLLWIIVCEQAAVPATAGLT